MHGHSHRTPVCGLRAGVTLVLAGMTRGNPFRPWASAVVEGGDLVATVEQASAARAPADAPTSWPQWKVGLSDPPTVR